VLAAVIWVANLPTSIHVGVNGYFRQIHMPLYVKWTQFLARHYEYERLARQITAGCRTEEEKVLAILRWTKSNLRNVPAGMPVCDDHTLYIIIRGYGMPGQFQDIFTTLCAYAGLPAFFGKAYDRQHNNKYNLSFVKLHGKWRVFDAYYGKYFKSSNGDIAAVEDILKDHSLIKGNGVDAIVINGIPYSDFYYTLDLSTARNGSTLRPYRQMPFQRILYEIKKAFKIEKDE